MYVEEHVLSGVLYVLEHFFTNEFIFSFLAFF